MTYPEDYKRWADNRSTLTALNAVMKPFEDVISAANLEAEEGQEQIDLDGDMTEQTFKTVFDLGVDHLKSNVIPHVYTNGKSQQRFGQCHWSSFRQWVKPAVTMKTGNAAACKYLALQITTAGEFEREADISNVSTASHRSNSGNLNRGSHVSGHGGRNSDRQI